MNKNYFVNYKIINNVKSIELVLKVDFKIIYYVFINYNSINNNKSLHSY